MVRPLIWPLPRGAGFGEFKNLPLKTRGDHSFEFNLVKDHAHFSVGSLFEHCYLRHFLGNSQRVVEASTCFVSCLLPIDLRLAAQQHSLTS